MLEEDINHSCKNSSLNKANHERVVSPRVDLHIELCFDFFKLIVFGAFSEPATGISIQWRRTSCKTNNLTLFQASIPGLDCILRHLKCGSMFNIFRSNNQRKVLSCVAIFQLLQHGHIYNYASATSSKFSFTSSLLEYCIYGNSMVAALHCIMGIQLCEGPESVYSQCAVCIFRCSASNYTINLNSHKTNQI